jgi:glycine/D-amino acid oxidase-like deaminating enzyme/nitrite reductase/ring-hydroxylating ferredoxin subunit
MKKAPIWQETSLPSFPRTSANSKFDIVIVGGGIAGLATAYLLKQAGKTVAVIERERLAAADTGHTTAHLTYVTDTRLHELASAFGEEAAGRVWEAGRIAIDKIEEIATSEGIDCDFRRVPGYLHAALESDKDESDDLRKDAELAEKLGFDATYQEAVPHFHKPGIRFADQAKFNPRAFLAGLAKKIDGDGSAIFEESEATEFKSDPMQVVAGGYTLDCDYVVICTHVPLMGLAGLVSASLLQTKLYPYTSYVLGAKLPTGLIPEASFWDTADPYYYLRIDRHTQGDYAIFGGKDHKTGQETDPEKRFVELADVLQKWLPEAKVDHRWSGQVIETNDGLPFIGETAERQFVSTGFAGNGMTFGVFSALMACDAAQGKKSGWHELFKPDRTKVRGGTLDYLRENIDFPYYFVRDRLTSPGDAQEADIKRNDGAIIRVDGKRVACYRNSQGGMTHLSPVCTHMGCIVRWNTAEKSWDCPCHGSRFHPTGEVMAGPAETSLKPVEVAAAKK